MNFLELIRSGLHKAKELGGGGMVGYFDDSSHITPTIQTDTPFYVRVNRALDIVDRRDGYAIHIAKLWRGAACIASVLAIIGYGGWGWQASKSTVEWLEVPVDKFGEPGEISTPVPFTPSTAQLAERAQEVVKSAFSLSTDYRVNESNYEFLRNTLRGDAVRSWAAWYNDNKDPSVTERVVQILTIKPSGSPNTLNVAWTEQDMHNGEIIRGRRVNADLTLQYKKPANRAEAMKNKLSIYVTALRLPIAPETWR